VSRVATKGRKASPIQTLLLSLVVSGVMAYAFNTYIYAPSKPALARLQAREAQMRFDNEAVRGSIARYGMPRLKARIAQYQGMRGELDRLIPPGDSLLDVLGVLHQAARYSGVELTGVKPDSNVGVGEYVRRGWTITAVGAYEKLGVFLTTLAGQPHIMRPVRVQLTQGLKTDVTEEATQDPRTVVRMAFTLETIWNSTSSATTSAALPPLPGDIGLGMPAMGAPPALPAMPAVGAPVTATAPVAADEATPSTNRRPLGGYSPAQPITASQTPDTNSSEHP